MSISNNSNRFRCRYRINPIDLDVDIELINSIEIFVIRYRIRSRSMESYKFNFNSINYRDRLKRFRNRSNYLAAYRCKLILIMIIWSGLLCRKTKTNHERIRQVPVTESQKSKQMKVVLPLIWMLKQLLSVLRGPMDQMMRDITVGYRTFRG